MGNRITDVGKMKSHPSVGNRMRIFDGVKHAKLGTEKNQAVVTVQTESRLEEVTAAFEEKGWKYRIELEPDKPEDISDLTRLLNLPKPRIVEKKVGLNSPVPAAAGRSIKNAARIGNGQGNT